MPSATFGRALIEEYFEAFNKADWSRIAALADDDVVYDPFFGPREIGRDSLRRHLTRMGGHLDETVGDLLVFVSDDKTRAAAEFTLRGRYMSSIEGLPAARHQRYSVAAAAFFSLDGDRITRISNYRNQQQWNEQVSS